MKIVVFGMGYVGLASAVLLSEHHEVVAIDLDKSRIKAVNSRRSPIADPEIEAKLESGSLNLVATDDVATALRGARFAIVATPTDYDVDTDYFNTSSVEKVLQQIEDASPSTVAVIKSTIPIGFTDRMVRVHPQLSIVFSPEFLREGRALYDNQHPSRIVSASYDVAAAEEFAELLSSAAHSRNVPTLICNPNEAESIKLFSNTYLAMRVAFFNELDTFAKTQGLDTKQIVDGVSLDPRIGTHYNNPSFGYGGYCLPKDTRQLLANYKGIPQTLMSAIVTSNERRKKFIAELVLKHSPKTVGINRLTMKSGSDNFRSSSIQDVMQMLREAGVEILIFEPTIRENEFDGVEVIGDFQTFSERSDVIISNRWDEALEPVRDKVISADLYTRD